MIVKDMEEVWPGAKILSDLLRPPMIKVSFPSEHANILNIHHGSFGANEP